jgi:hypothetical protein
MLLIDTSAWIEFLNNQPTPQAAYIETAIQNDRDIFICGIILTEILQGIRDDARHAAVKEALLRAEFIAARRSTYLYAADLYRSLRRKGVTIRNAPDCIIASLCIENEIPLLHHDRDFDHIAQYSKLETITP